MRKPGFIFQFQSFARKVVTKFVLRGDESISSERLSILHSDSNSQFFFDETSKIIGNTTSFLYIKSVTSIKVFVSCYQAISESNEQLININFSYRKLVIRIWGGVFKWPKWKSVSIDFQIIFFTNN